MGRKTPLPDLVEPDQLPTNHLDLKHATFQGRSASAPVRLTNIRGRGTPTFAEVQLERRFEKKAANYLGRQARNRKQDDVRRRKIIIGIRYEKTEN